jgi:hypothetical protein
MKADSSRNSVMSIVNGRISNPVMSLKKTTTEAHFMLDLTLETYSDVFAISHQLSAIRRKDEQELVLLTADG